MVFLLDDALRNAAMRFGVALDLWSKEELDALIWHPSVSRRVMKQEAAGS